MSKIVFDINLGRARRRPDEIADILYHSLKEVTVDSAIDFRRCGDSIACVSYGGRQILILFDLPGLRPAEFSDRINEADMAVVLRCGVGSRLASTVADYHSLAVISLKLENLERLSPSFSSFMRKGDLNDTPSYTIAVNMLAGFLLEVLKWAASLAR